MTNSEDWPDRRFRRDVELEADVRYPNGHGSKAMISNLSSDGCRLTGLYRIGEQLELEIPGIGSVRGQVRWAIGGEAGVRFSSNSDRDGDGGQSAFS